MTKICTSCNLEKDTSEFNIRKASKDGLEHSCKICKKSKFKNYYNKNKVAIINRVVNYHKANLEKHRAVQKVWDSKNRKSKLEYEKQKRKIDPNFKIAGSLRRRLTAALKGNNKSGSAIKDLGCSVDELRIYIESLWQPGMTWDNYGIKGWHIDHIKPLSSFILTDKDELKQACNFRNLQPLWAEENLSKGNKLEYNNTDVKST